MLYVTFTSLGIGGFSWGKAVVEQRPASFHVQIAVAIGTILMGDSWICVNLCVLRAAVYHIHSLYTFYKFVRMGCEL